MIYNETDFTRFFHFVHSGDGCIEFIAYNARFNKLNKLETSHYKITYAGWFDRINTLKGMCKRLAGVSAYATINPVNRDLMARAANTIVHVKKDQVEATHKKDILSIRHILIDIDHTRDKGVSSTADELNATIATRNLILDENPAIRAASIWGVSGNGSYILLRLSEPLPNTEPNEDMVNDFLRALASRYGEKGQSKVHIDTQTSFSSIHIGIPGTKKCKGSDTVERPHRVITIDGGCDE